MDKTTHERLIPCEKHAAILGREAARLVQRGEPLDGLWTMLIAVMGDRMGPCSEDGCIVGDDRE